MIINFKIKKKKYLGFSPFSFVKKSNIRAGRKCMKMAEILKRIMLGINLRWGYQIEDSTGFKCNNGVIRFSTCFQRNGLHVDEVQWKILSSPHLNFKNNSWSHVNY